ncbi:MAG: glycoside hydrolase family 2 TIM barrel-domain containing protein [Clostridia bacterium]|nr:glycoside hydrolase family 2 TIM barrel-domain containing protein [Clostridia bacterium]
MIKTKWVDSIPRIPLNDYPRPQMVRNNWQCLNGTWEYSVIDINSAQNIAHGEILVPFAIETALSGVCRQFLPDERLHYKRKFEIDGYKNEGRVLLHFEAVDWKCTVYVNGCIAGNHTGGYLPFTLDITALLIDGENTLEVSVTDPTDTNWQQRGKQVLEPKGIWYTATSGIWQTVWLEVVPEAYIKSIRLTPCIDLESISIYVDSSINETASIEISDSEETVLKTTINTNCENIISFPAPKLWSPENPFLYDVRIVTDSDSVKSYFGMRSVSMQTGPAGLERLLLNKKPIFLNGPLDQGYWPESGMTPPCDEAIIFDLQGMKDLGFNTIRKHIKIESRRWYYHADRLGLLVIQDMPNGGKSIAGALRTMKAVVFGDFMDDSTEKSYGLANRSDDDSRSNYEQELAGMLNHLHNSPSVIIWCPFNESWGQFDAKRIYEKVKSMDKTRPVYHASGCFVQICGYLRSIHTYKLKLMTPPK